MKYRTIIRANVKKKLTYNMAAIINLFSSILIIFLLSFFWKVIYKQDVEKYQYIFMFSIITNIQAAFFMISSANEIQDKIRSGNIVYDLIRPWNYLFNLLFLDVGAVVANIIVMVVPILIFSLIFFSLPIPSILILLIFIVSLLLGFLILFLIRTITALLCFWMIETWSLIILLDSVILFFSGKFIPTWLMPKAIVNIMESLPFIWIYQRPAEIYLSDPADTSTLFNYIFYLPRQLGWVVFLSLMLAFIWKKMTKRLIIQGG